MTILYILYIFIYTFLADTVQFSSYLNPLLTFSLQLLHLAIKLSVCHSRHALHCVHLHVHVVQCHVYMYMYMKSVPTCIYVIVHVLSKRYMYIWKVNRHVHHFTSTHYQHALSAHTISMHCQHTLSACTISMRSG